MFPHLKTIQYFITLKRYKDKKLATDAPLQSQDTFCLYLFFLIEAPRVKISEAERSLAIINTAVFSLEARLLLRGLMASCLKRDLPLSVVYEYTERRAAGYGRTARDASGRARTFTRGLPLAHTPSGTLSLSLSLAL